MRAVKSSRPIRGVTVELKINVSETVSLSNIVVDD
jgi:hypothetical protein